MNQNTSVQKDRFYQVASVVAVILAFIAILFLVRSNNKLMDSYEKKDELAGQVDSLLDYQVKIRPDQPSIPRMNAYEWDRLRRKGLTNPEAELVDDLMRNQELIPYEGTLGGTMNFYMPENIFFMNDKWAFAYFEDGHKGGNALLRFSVENGEISWEVLDAYID